MKIFAYAFPFIATIGMATSTSTATSLDCFDNEAFFIEGNPLHDCLWISENEVNRSTQCQVREVRENCPFVCGKCCEDRADFQFSIHDANEGLKNCAWLVNNDKSHCNSEYHGTNVAHACPKACNTCREPVPFEEIASLEWSPKSDVIRGRALQTTICVDDPNYRSPLNVNFGCEIYETGGSCVCESFGVFLSDEELQDVLESCQATCRICSESPSASPTLLAASQNPTGSPSMTPSKAPTDGLGETPTMTPSKAPTDRPSASPSPSFTPRTSSCDDNPNFESPVNSNFGCEIHNTGEDCDCTTWSVFLNEEQMESLYANCPETCGVPCCEDNPNYVHPIVPIRGCDVYPALNCTCDTFESFMTAEQMQDLYENCPVTCGLCENSKSPSISPTKPPTRFPSPRPSSTISPTKPPTRVPSPRPSSQPPCTDDPSYISPINPSFGCELHNIDGVCDCESWSFLLSLEELEDLFASCPETCGVPCDVTTRPSISPSSSPTACADDPRYISPINPSFGCELHNIDGVCDCESWSFLLTPEELKDLFARCPDTCGVPCDVTTEPCPDLKCAESRCVTRENTNLAPLGVGSSLHTSQRSNVNGPLDGSSETTFGSNGSNYESSDAYVNHWWQVDLQDIFTIAQVKIFACEGPLCHPEGKQLGQIRVDIYNGPIIVSSYAFFDDRAPILDIVLPVEIQGQTIRVSKLTTGKILSLSEVWVIGRQ